MPEFCAFVRFLMSEEIINYDYKKGYPAGNDLFYECLECHQRLPSMPVDNIGCSCGNIFIDMEAGRFIAINDEHVRLVRIV